MLVRTAWGRLVQEAFVRPPPPVPVDPAVLLAWAARVRECAEVASAQALTLRWRVDQRGLTGPAGDALAGLGASVAGQLTTLAAQAGSAALALVRAAHEAAIAREAMAREAMARAEVSG